MPTTDTARKKDIRRRMTLFGETYTTAAQIIDRKHAAESEYLRRERSGSKGQDVLPESWPGVQAFHPWLSRYTDLPDDVFRDSEGSLDWHGWPASSTVQRPEPLPEKIRLAARADEDLWAQASADHRAAFSFGGTAPLPVAFHQGRAKLLEQLPSGATINQARDVFEDRFFRQIWDPWYWVHSGLLHLLHLTGGTLQLSPERTVTLDPTDARHHRNAWARYWHLSSVVEDEDPTKDDTDDEYEDWDDPEVPKPDDGYEEHPAHQALQDFGVALDLMERGLPPRFVSMLPDLPDYPENQLFHQAVDAAITAFELVDMHASALALVEHLVLLDPGTHIERLDEFHTRPAQARTDRNRYRRH